MMQTDQGKLSVDKLNIKKKQKPKGFCFFLVLYFLK